VCVVCVAFAYMSVLGQQPVAGLSPVYNVMQSSFSLHDLQSHARSQFSPHDLHSHSRSQFSPDVSWNTNMLSESTLAMGTVEFCVSSEEFQSMRQRTVQSSLSGNVFIESDATCKSVRSYHGGNSQEFPAVLVSRASVEPERNAGSGVILRSDRSVDSTLRGGVGDACRSVESDHDVEVFSDLATTTSNNMEQPPPLPPKTSVVSENLSLTLSFCTQYVCLSVCLSVCLCLSIL